MVVSARAFNGRFITIGVTLIIVAVLINMLVERVSREMDNLEKTHFELRLAELRSALLLKQLEIRTRGFEGDPRQLAGTNPMRWIKGWPVDLPAYYFGEAELSNALEETGHWTYDPKQELIAYLPSTEEGFDVDANGQLQEGMSASKRSPSDRWLKYQVKVLMDGAKLKSLSLEFVK